MTPPEAAAPTRIDRSLKTRRVKLSALVADEANKRTHDERNLAAIEESIRKHGVVEPLVVQKGTNRIVAGNGRAEALRRLGYTHVDVVDVEIATEQEFRALSIRLNRTGELAGWDGAGLEADLAILANAGWGNLPEFGFDEATLDALAKDVESPTPGRRVSFVAGDGSGKVNADDPGPDTKPTDANSKPGMVYQLGPHRLICGDSTKRETWDALLGDEKVQMVWTDPPYGVAVNAVESVEEARRLHRRTDGKIVQNDDLSPEELEVFLTSSLGTACDACVPGAAWYVAAPPGPLHTTFALVLSELNIWRQSLMWLKDRFAFGRSDYHYRHEALFYGWKPGAAHYFVDDRTQDTVLEFPRPTKSEEHPTMKPVELVKKCIENSSMEGWIVADPFGGSGTTLVASAQAGRIARLIELDPGYCDVIRRRWTKLARAAGVDPGSGALE